VNSQKIAKLETLLDRVKTRASAPRAAAVRAAVPAATAVAPLLVEDVPSSEDVTQLHVPMPSEAGAEMETSSAMEASDAEIEEMLDADIEVSTELIEIDVEEEGPATTDSSAEIVLEPIDEFAVAEALSQSDLTAESTPEPVFANELEAEPPVSSRRPVSLESAAEEEPSAPRHTPPPESGKQVAAPPFAAAASKPTAVGAWREPGMPEGHVPERVSPVLPAAANVVKLEAEALAFKPANFGDLLDATLAL